MDLVPKSNNGHNWNNGGYLDMDFLLNDGVVPILISWVWKFYWGHVGQRSCSWETHAGGLIDQMSLPASSFQMVCVYIKR